MCFGQREAIGIIGQDDRDAEPGGQVILEGLTIQNNRIAIFHHPETWVQDTRRSKSDRVGFQPRSMFHICDEVVDLVENMVISPGGFGIYTGSNNGVGMMDGLEDHAFDLSAAEINSP
jgi:hypothetical protein